VPNPFYLDARELEAPLPLQKALEIARGLKESEYLCMRHRMWPCKLGDMLSGLGIDHFGFEMDGQFLFFAFLKNDAATKEFLKEEVAREYGRTIAQ